MIITCKECESSFQVDDRLIQENGSKVRCSKCSAVFVVYPPALDAGATPESDGGPESDDLELDLGLDLEAEEGNDDVLMEGLETAESELDLDEFDETGDKEPPAASELLDSDEFELELGPDADLDEDDDLVPGGLESEDDELSDLGDLGDLAGLDDGELSEEDLDAELEDLDAELAGLDLDADIQGDADEDLDLDFQVGEDGQTADAASAAGADDELDLSDLDEMLESDEAPAAEAGSEDDAEELDLDLEGEWGEQKELFETSAADGGELLASSLLDDEDEDFLEEVGDEELEFSNGAGAVTGSAISDDFATDEFTETGDYGQTDVLPDEGDKAPATGAPRAPKVRSKKPALVAVLVLIFVIGILIIPRMLGIKIPYVSDIKIPYLSDVDMKIPFLSDLINPEKQDVAGNLKINPLGRTINGRFVENSDAGRLFVIQGKVKNEYDHPRSFIKVTGKLFQKEGKVVKTATVYCGNVLSGVELNAMNMTGIKRRLKNKFGDRRSNVKVAKGRMLPFMIVFDQLPRNLDEFSIEVTGSSI